jgi:general L-amino acid transport system permease protein
MKTIKHDPFKTPAELKHPAWHWIRKNLLSSPLNALLTVLSLFVIYELVVGTFIPISRWDWTVIGANMKLILCGSYPVSEIWRLWVCVTYAVVFAGLTFRIAVPRRPPAVMYLLGAFFLLLASLGISAYMRVFLVVDAALLFGVFFASKLVAQRRITSIVVAGWVLLLPFCFLFVRGDGWLLPVVKTNLWGGLLLSLLISLTSIFCSMPLGLLLALGRRSRLKIIKAICVFFIEVVRGVPLITILFIGYLILPMALPASMTPSVFIRAMVGIIMFHSAYMAEAFRGGLQGICKTQYEAATSLNLGPVKTMGLVILPQVLKRLIPVLVNSFTSALKDTSLISIIGMLDLIGVSTSIVSNPKYFAGSAQVLFFEGAIYFILCYGISRASIFVEKKLGVKSKVGQ